MALPPKNDPRRPIFLAASSMRLLGGLLILLAGLLGAVGAFASRGPRGGSVPVGAIVVTLILGLAGVAFLVSSIFVVRRQKWAVVLGLVLTGLELLLSVLSIAGLLVSGGLGNPAVTVPLVITVLFFAAYVQLAVHLSKALTAIDLPPWGKGEAARGFEVIRPADPAA